MKTITDQNLLILWNRMKAYVNDRELVNVVDLVSDQTANGVKTFANGIVIGDEGVELTYDASEGAFKIAFLTESTETETEATAE